MTRLPQRPHSENVPELRRKRPRPLIRVMGLMGKRFWPYCVAFTVRAATIAICFNIILAFLMRDVIDAAVQNDVALIRRAVLLALGTFLGGTPVLVGTRYLVACCIQRTMADLRTRLFVHIADLPVDTLEGRHSGDLVSRATNDLQQIEEIYFNQLSTVLIAVIMGISGIAAIFALDWRVGVIATALGLLTTIANVTFAKPMQRAAIAVQARSATVTERLVDLLQSIPVTRLFGLAERIHGHYRSSTGALANAKVRMGRVQSRADLVNTSLQWLQNVGLLGLGLLLYQRGELALGSVWAVVSLQGNASFLFSSVGQFVTGIQQSVVAASRVFEILDQETEPDCLGERSCTPLPVPQVPQADSSRTLLTSTSRTPLTSSSITMRNVYFRYPEKGVPKNNRETELERTALNGLTLTVPAGQIAALVGPSGAGKSTVAKLLLGFYPADAGTITIAGQPIDALPLKTLRELIAFVPQEAHLFDGTIEWNIQLGRPDATAEEIVAAAKAAGAHDFIVAQPDGYQTSIGERGARLSGGQRQRIAIARAVLKNAPFLLLDEATSALDSESEAIVQEALSRLMAERTTLAIAHRLSTIEGADIIHVIDQGRVVEQGTHVSLLTQNGLYTQLHTLQFA